MADDNGALPAYTTPDVKARLLAQGASGTIYALVMPESEAGIQRVVDGCDVHDFDEDAPSGTVMDAVLEKRDENWLSLFREPWYERQNTMDVEYFDRWTLWASPIVKFDPDGFPFRYATAGASQGIEKLLAECITRAFKQGTTPILHVFEGEYEGFSAYAKGLECDVHVHDRSNWQGVVRNCEPGFFFVSQPSAIDGMVWEDFDAFCALIDEERTAQIEVVPDLTYVGSTAREWTVSMDHHCINAFVISHSKPFGLYYHRVGGVFARKSRPTLLGNVWFKNLTSIRIGIEMMKAHRVFDLPRKYLAQQKEAVLRIAQRLRLDGLEPCDILVMAKAPVQKGDHPLKSLERGCSAERVVRVCLTPQMTDLIDRRLAPITSASLRLHGIEAGEDDVFELEAPVGSDPDSVKRAFADDFAEARISAKGGTIRIIIGEEDLKEHSTAHHADVVSIADPTIAREADQIVLRTEFGKVRLLKGYMPAGDEDHDGSEKA
jgi:hypothetical protein